MSTDRYFSCEMCILQFTASHLLMVPLLHFFLLHFYALSWKLSACKINVNEIALKTMSRWEWREAPRTEGQKSHSSLTMLSCSQILSSRQILFGFHVLIFAQAMNNADSECILTNNGFFTDVATSSSSFACFKITKKIFCEKNI